MSALRMIPDHTALIVVDMQQKLIPAIADSQGIVARAVQLVKGAALLEIPVIVTRQYPRGLGDTVAAVREALPADASVHDKVRFSGFVEGVRTQLTALDARSVVVCGVEAHVCVLQTCLDLIDAGYVTAVACDAVGSRRPEDLTAAQRRMDQAGVVPTTAESALFEWTVEAGGERFKRLRSVLEL